MEIQAFFLANLLFLSSQQQELSEMATSLLRHIVELQVVGELIQLAPVEGRPDFSCGLVELVLYHR